MWVSLIVGLLKIANMLLTWAQQSKLIRQGEDAAIAEQTRQIFAKTEAAKRRMEKVDAMSEDEVDAALLELEPGGVRKPQEKS